MLTWYKFWFRRSGALNLEGYVRHIIAAHLIFFGFGFLGVVLFWLILGPMIALKAPASLSWLPLLVGFVFMVLAFGSYIGILVASTKRFFRAGRIANARFALSRKRFGTVIRDWQGWGTLDSSTEPRGSNQTGRHPEIFCGIQIFATRRACTPLTRRGQLSGAKRKTCARFEPYRF
jgi:hypothetical protein